jgi:hypothetical protein
VGASQPGCADGVSYDPTWAQSAFGFPRRALVVDPHRVLRWSYQAPSPGDLRGVELLRDGLSAAFADA